MTIRQTIRRAHFCKQEAEEKYKTPPFFIYSCIRKLPKTRTRQCQFMSLLCTNSSLAFPGIDPTTPLGISFPDQTKTYLIAGVEGIKFTPGAPSPRAKKPEYPPSALYLYSNNKYHDLSIFNHLSVYFFLFLLFFH